MPECHQRSEFRTELHGLKGKTAIESFFQVAVMANAGMTRTIKFMDNKINSITAFVTFVKGGKLHGRFTFNFETDNARRIKRLWIQFKE